MNGCCCFSLLFPSSKIRTLQINCFCFFGSMAAASLCGFLSFLLPSQPQIAKNLPTQLIASYPRLSSDSLPIRSSSSLYMSFQSRRKIDGVFPVMENGFSSFNDFLSVVCPSLVNANILFFKSAYNVQVIVDENEPEEKLLGRFRREVMKAGVIQECKRRRFYENKQDKKKRKSREAARRNRRSLILTLVSSSDEFRHTKRRFTRVGGRPLNEISSVTRNGVPSHDTARKISWRL